MSFLFPKYQLSDKEKQIKDIIENLLNDSNTTKLMDPITSHYYLDNKKLGYFMVISYSFVKITNHKFYYTENISGRFSSEIEKSIRIAISKDRRRIEDEMFKNESDLLTKIQNNCSKKV
tara:strand:- start:645 stop:1001 length:357 start_codon:yes stop_codon:yes gene_type:complete